MKNIKLIISIFIIFLIPSYSCTVKYFLTTKGVRPNGITSNYSIFEGEMKKEPIYIKNGFNTYFKVYYENNKPTKAEKMYVENNTTKINLGTVFKFDKKGREVYFYETETDEKCVTFYGINYSEITCILNNEMRVTKNYYKNDSFIIAIDYIDNQIKTYTKTKKDEENFIKTLYYNQNGKSRDLELEALYRLEKRVTNKIKKKKIQKMIHLEIEKNKNTPDLNLTLEKQYIEKIDRLNKISKQR